MPAKEGSTGVHASVAPSRESTSKPAIVWKWRVVDIVVAAVLGVACGLIFLLWNVAYLGPKGLLEPLLPGLQGLLDGPWLLAGVLGAVVIRKPGAAIFTEVIAAIEADPASGGSDLGARYLLSQVKFHEPARPGAVLQIRVAFEPAGAITFAVTEHGRPIASGRFAPLCGR